MQCSKCGADKPMADFEKRPDSKLGYRRTCKGCRRDAKNATNRRYVTRHRERINAERREEYRRDPEPHRARDRRYIEKHRDKRNARQREYYRRNREWLLANKMTQERRRTEVLLDHTYDGIEYEIWQKQNALRESQRRAMARTDAILESVSPEARTAAERYMSDGGEIPPHVLSELRKAAGL